MKKAVATTEAVEVQEPAAVEPITERAKLSGPGLLFNCYVQSGCSVPPCSLKIPGKILEVAGIRPNNEVELAADPANPGEIHIKKIGEGPALLPAYGPATEPRKGTVLAELFRLGRQRDEELKLQQKGEPYDEDGFLEDGDGEA